MKEHFADIQLNGRIELDETFVGGKNKNRHADKKVKQSQGRSFKDKTPVMGMLEEAEKEIVYRPNKNNPLKIVKEKIYHKDTFVRCFVVPDTTSESLKPIIRKNVTKNSVLISDEWCAYEGLNAEYDHRVIDHARKQYVNECGDTSNSLEGFWTWFKRSYIGVYHSMSRKHMQAYSDEISFRYNTHREKDKIRFDRTLIQTIGRRLPYKVLVNQS